MLTSSRLMIIFCICLLVQEVKAQTDSCRLRISLLTCGPGDDLYSIWGHTGIRVIDSVHQADVVFNYGTFNDRDPPFLYKIYQGYHALLSGPLRFQRFYD